MAYQEQIDELQAANARMEQTNEDFLTSQRAFVKDTLPQMQEYWRGDKQMSALLEEIHADSLRMMERSEQLCASRTEENQAQIRHYQDLQEEDSKA